MDRPVARGLERGRSELNATRTRLGLPALDRVFGGLSEQLCLVGTFPGLEYPRPWPASTEVVGPLLWEPPADEVEPPPGDAPLVLVAVSTAQDPNHELLRAALVGLAGEPVRVLAATNRRPLQRPVTVPDNARLVDWVSYARTMPHSAAVISHAGHGTVVRALASGAPLLAVPHSGDMGENAARIDWAGVGVRLPWRWLSPRSLRAAMRRLLADHQYAERTAEFAAWAGAHDGAARAAELVERLGTSGV
jgi:UDP:flavonoid glycosyltransferase YjiC (YdhE family)